MSLTIDWKSLTEARLHIQNKKDLTKTDAYNTALIEAQSYFHTGISIRQYDVLAEAKRMRNIALNCLNGGKAQARFAAACWLTLLTECMEDDHQGCARCDAAQVYGNIARKATGRVHPSYDGLSCFYDSPVLEFNNSDNDRQGYCLLLHLHEFASAEAEKNRAISLADSSNN